MVRLYAYVRCNKNHVVETLEEMFEEPPLTFHSNDMKITILHGVIRNMGWAEVWIREREKFTEVEAELQKPQILLREMLERFGWDNVKAFTTREV